MLLIAAPILHASQSLFFKVKMFLETKKTSVGQSYPDTSQSL